MFFSFASLPLFFYVFMFVSCQDCSPQDRRAPLFLTPLIEAGNLKCAKQLSRVTDTRFNCGTESYSGYLTVNKTYNSNLFFWFFKTQNPKAPIAVWLNGGPGSSTMSALFYEHGPFIVKKDLSIKCRKYSWAKYMSMIYIDQPVGTGFSFTENLNGFSKDIKESTDNLYEALVQFFTLFKEFQGNEFYAIGSSYGGKFAPAIAQRIHRERTPIINLKGVAAGNGFFDPYSIFDSIADYMYELSLIDEKLKTQLEEKQEGIKQLINEEKYEEAFFAAIALFFLQPNFVSNSTGYHYLFNVLFTNDPTNKNPLFTLMDSRSIKKSLHVGNRTFVSGEKEPNIAVLLAVKGDYMRSVKDIVVDVMNSGYRVLFYGGNLDITVNPVTTRKILKSLEEWNDREAYFNANQEIWKLKGEENNVAGYVKRANNFSLVVVRNAGHNAPIEQHKVMFYLIKKFVFNTL